MNHIRNSKLLVLNLILLSLVFAGAIVFCRAKTNNQKVISTPLPGKTVTLPSRNLIVYTRCYNGERQPDYCNLYASSLDQPEEKFIFKFDYPNVEQSDFEQGYDLQLLGATNQQAIYKKIYWEKIPEYVYHIVIGNISLTTGKDNVIYQQMTFPPINGVSNPKDTDMLTSTFLDKTNQKIYYTTQNTKSVQTTIHQFDLSSSMKKSWPIADINQSYYVNFAKDNVVYLSHVVNFVSIDHYITNTFDINTGTLALTPTVWLRGVINNQGTKVAYINQSPEKPNGMVSLSLIVSDLDGANTKEIYTIPNTYLPTDGSIQSYTTFDDIFFNAYGTSLNYAVVNRKPNTEPVKTKYYTAFEINNHTGEKNTGIMIEPVKNPLMYKSKYKLPNSVAEYKWTKYTVNTPPFEGNTDEAIYYEADGGWYFVPYHGEISKLFDSTISERKIIAVDAKNLIVVSK